MVTLDDYMYPKRRPSLSSNVNTIQCSGKFIRDENIAGMNLQLNRNAMIVKLTKGWLYRVWRRFHWQVKKGVGLNKSILMLARWWKKLIIIIDTKDEVYVADPNLLIETCSKWITKTTKTGTPIYACPVSIFYRYKGENLKQVKEKLKQLGKGKTMRDFQVVRIGSSKSNRSL